MWKPFTIVGDNHGDMEDKEAVKIFHKFVKDYQPTIRIHLGDNWDFRPLRSKASKIEQLELMMPDFKQGIEFIKKYRPTHFLRGNHDERLWDLAKRNEGMLSEFADRLVHNIEYILKQFKAPILPYDKRNGVLQIGKLRVIHGYTHGVNAAKRSAEAYGSVIMGHVHSTQTSSIPGLDYRVGRSNGCLCRLDMEYSRATMASLAHNHGWAYGIINSNTGEYGIWQAENINGLWMFPKDIKIMKGENR